MKTILLLTLCLPLATPSNAATKLFLRTISSAGTPAIGADTASGSTGFGCNNLTGPQQLRRAVTTAGPGVLTVVHTPTSAAPPCQMASAAAYFTWYSDPLAAGLTLAGNIDFSVTCSESSTTLNAGMRMIVKRWSASTGGIAETLMTGADSAECNGARLAVAAAAPTSTVFNSGDRLVLIVEIRNVGGGWGGNSSRTVTLSLDAASGATGDTFVNLADTLSFASDTNNAPAKGFGQ